MFVHVLWFTCSKIIMINMIWHGQVTRRFGIYDVRYVFESCVSNLPDGDTSTPEDTWFAVSIQCPSLCIFRVYTIFWAQFWVCQYLLQKMAMYYNGMVFHDCSERHQEFLFEVRLKDEIITKGRFSKLTLSNLMYMWEKFRRKTLHHNGYMLHTFFGDDTTSFVELCQWAYMYI